MVIKVTFRNAFTFQRHCNWHLGIPDFWCCNIESTVANIECSFKETKCCLETDDLSVTRISEKCRILINYDGCWLVRQSTAALCTHLSWRKNTDTYLTHGLITTSLRYFFGTI